MEIKSTLNNLKIIHSSFVLLRVKEDDFAIEIKTENGLNIKIIMEFVENIENSEQRMVAKVENNIVTLQCTNFNNPLGSGALKPIDLAIVNDKHLYIVFWVYDLRNGCKKVEYELLVEE